MGNKHRMLRGLSVLLTAALITSMDRPVLVRAQEPTEEPLLSPQESDAFPEDPGLLSQHELEEWIARTNDLLGQHQHDMACGYREAEPETACDGGCTALDENGTILHSADCAYRPAGAVGTCRFTEEWKRRLEILTLTLQEENSQDNTETPEDSRDETDTDAPEDSKGETEQAEEIQDGTGTTEDSQDNTETPEDNRDGTDITEDSSQEEPKKEADDSGGDSREEDENAETPALSEDERKGDESNAGNEAQTTEKTVDEEVQEETENQGEHDIPDNEPEYTIHIPAEVILNDTSTFTVETIADREISEGAVLMTVTGTAASQESEDFALFLEGNEEITWEYRLRMNHTLVGPRQNQVILEPGNSAQEVEVVPVSPAGKFPAGTYRGSLSFRVTYKKGEAVQEKQISEETAQ